MIADKPVPLPEAPRTPRTPRTRRPLQPVQRSRTHRLARAKSDRLKQKLLAEYDRAIQVLEIEADEINRDMLLRQIHNLDQESHAASKSMPPSAALTAYIAQIKAKIYDLEGKVLEIRHVVTSKRIAMLRQKAAEATRMQDIEAGESDADAFTQDWVNDQNRQSEGSFCSMNLDSPRRPTPRRELPYFRGDTEPAEHAGPDISYGRPFKREDTEIVLSDDEAYEPPVRTPGEWQHPTAPALRAQPTWSDTGSD
ncbi:hypothetical protein HGRIS_000379 [Hohenbuehelia grisea]|uniref:Uncharacterized protein n=1 Tax=Hohenbuehelia grisea TaxID=104357 RepID=A0ABR3JQV5_9AGAR